MGTPIGARVDARMFAPRETLYAPELLYVEVTQSLGRLVQTQALSISRAEQGLDDLLDLRVKHFPQTLVLRRVWELRNSLSAYDAVYVSIAETLEAPLLTCDRKLALAHGHRARVEVF
jgi:predicted nucleic acid-binding protein